MRKELLIAALGISVSGALDAATQQEVERLLSKIAKAPVPDRLYPSADCYRMALPPTREEYVCTVCGTKTLYTKNEQNDYRYQFLHLVRDYSTQCAKLRKQGLDVKLDATFLCSKCRKSDQPKEFFLEVTIDGKTTRTKMQHDDLPKLIAFMQGKTIWEGERDAKMPLQPELPRIRELLGMPEEKPTEKSK